MAVERSCCACRKRRGKESLVRFVATSGGVDLDVKGTAPGRGGYVCRTVSCIDLALKRGALARTLRVALPAEQAGALRDRFVGYLGVVDGRHQSS